MGRTTIFVLAIFLASSLPADACLWDYDTLKEEALGDKDVADIVRGRIRTHSRGFYERKIAYTQPLLEKQGAKPERWDDLAVAHAKLGNVDEAIAVMEAKEQAFPGLYTTEANLGTFHAMKGETAEGVAHLKKAIEINPDAHFGREKYQVQLLEFLVATKDKTIGPETFLGIADDGEDHPLHSYLRNGSPELFATSGLGKDVYTGIVGMIRFGGGEDSPHLWYALGHVLALRGDKHLALFALRRAELLGHPAARATAEIVLMHVKDLHPGGRFRSWDQIIPDLDEQFAKGQAWNTKEQQKEDALLAKGKTKKVFGY